MSPVLGYLFDSRGHRLTVLSATAVLMSAAFALLAFVHAAFVPWLAAVLIGIVLASCKSIGSPSLALLVSEHLVPEANLVNGILLMIGTISQTCIAGVIANNYGLQYVWWFCLGVSILTIIAAIAITIVNYRRDKASLQLGLGRTELVCIIDNIYYHLTVLRISDTIAAKLI